MKNDLTPKQADALAALVCFINTEGWAPTLDELVRHLDPTIETINAGKRSNANAILGALERKGYIVRGNGPRCIRLTPKASHRPTTQLEKVIAEANPDQIIRFSAELVVENRKLQADLAAKSLAVHVQKGLRRVESGRRKLLEKRLDRLNGGPTA